MASIDEHCSDCEKELGAPFREVHVWLDEFFSKLGPCHRKIRHHLGGVRQAKEKWGYLGAKAAEIHIRKDWFGLLPTEEKVKDWDVFGPDYIDDKGSEFLTDEQGEK